MAREPVVVDVEARARDLARALEDLGRGAPRQELGIALAIVDKVEHRARGVGNQHGLEDGAHDVAL